MTIGVVGRRCGMIRIFIEEDVSIPAMTVGIEPNRVAQFKTKEADGYRAVQITAGERRASRVTKAQAGHSAKANVAAGCGVWEPRLGEERYAAGDQVTVDPLRAGQTVDVTSGSKGKGFADTIKHWNFYGQDNTHGNFVSRRVLGSIGQCQIPDQVFRDEKISSHLDAGRVTVQSLEIVRVDAKRNPLLVKGVVPGVTGGGVIVHPTAKVRD